MNKSKKEKQTIGELWRKFGFFYDVRDEEQLCFLAGSRDGLLRFYDILMCYARDPRYAEISAHEHYGPYMYLEIMTWTKPGIDGHSIHGSKDDIQRLATIFMSKLRETPKGHHFIIGSDYATDSEYSVFVEVKEDNFDPASLGT